VKEGEKEGKKDSEGWKEGRQDSEGGGRKEGRQDSHCAADGCLVYSSSPPPPLPSSFEGRRVEGSKEVRKCQRSKGRNEGRKEKERKEGSKEGWPCVSLIELPYQICNFEPSPTTLQLPCHSKLQLKPCHIPLVFLTEDGLTILIFLIDLTLLVLIFVTELTLTVLILLTEMFFNFPAMCLLPPHY
jgi:hypothetical protein